MPLRRRLALVSAVAVGVAIVLAALVCYLVVRGQLRGQVDRALRDQANLVQQTGRFLRSLPGLPPEAGGAAPYSQVVTPDGQPVLPPTGGLELPFDAATRRVATGGRPVLEDLTVGGIHVRMLAFHGTLALNGQPVAVQLARPLGNVDRVLRRLRLILALLCAGGIALAAALGRLAARRVLAPLAEVARTAEHISQTEDLTSRIHAGGDDEIGQLAHRFNAMMERLQRSRGELDESVAAQRQLIADASHELRTPLTSLRTNVEVLLAGGQLEEPQRRRLLADVVEQSQELTDLVSDLIELARGEQPVEAVDDVRLDHVVESAVSRARRNTPGVVFATRLEPVVVEGVPERLERALNNLLDNAARHSPTGGTVEVQVSGDSVTVRDHGHGIDPQDLPRVFDRFYRGANARGQQGSGLGLAIVRQVALQHGGAVTAGNAPGGGAVFTLRLPGQAGDASLPGDEEALSQQPEQEPEHGHHGEEDKAAVPGLAQREDERDLEAHGRYPG